MNTRLKSITISIEQGHLEKDVKLPKGIELVEYPPLQKVDVVITSEDKKFEAVILLRPKEYIIGVGCRKGKAAIGRTKRRSAERTGIHRTCEK